MSFQFTHCRTFIQIKSNIQQAHSITRTHTRTYAHTHTCTYPHTYIHTQARLDYARGPAAVEARIRASSGPNSMPRKIWFSLRKNASTTFVSRGQYALPRQHHGYHWVKISRVTVASFLRVFKHILVDIVSFVCNELGGLHTIHEAPQLTSRTLTVSLATNATTLKPWKICQTTTSVFQSKSWPPGLWWIWFFHQLAQENFA